jgi:SAM-dependent methyltransferase
LQPEIDILLRCPETGEPLSRTQDGRYATDSGRSYAVLNGTPVLVRADNEFFAEQDDDSPHAPDAREWAGWMRALRKRLPSASLAIGSAERYADLAELLIQDAEHKPRVLVIGGGELGQGMEEFVANADLELVETDVYLGPRVAIVCDAHDLPFAEGVFDAVIVQAVLQHVISPTRVVEEIHRVLRPGGYVYAETPFMQQVHGGSFDFTRFTDLGHRRLFHGFDEVDRGVVCGPAMSLLWSLRYFARAIPRSSLLAAAALDLGVTMMFFWLKYLDVFFVKHAGARDGASGLFFMGRSRLGEIPDLDIIASYLGSIQPPF